MTKEEAIKAMSEGKKVRHRHFSSSEWMAQLHNGDYLLAMERSPIKDIEINHILKQALTDKINDRETFMKGIDYSYCYEQED